MQNPAQTHTKIKDLMQATREVIPVDEKLLDASIRLRRAGAPALAVVDGDEIVGILTAAAIAEKAASPDNDLTAAAARDLMSAEIGICRAHEEIDAARKVMAEEGHAQLLVVNCDGKLCGVLSAERLAGDAQEVAKRPEAKPDRHASHVVETGGRAKGDKPHHPKNYDVVPKLKD